METPKNGCFLLFNGTQYAKPKNGGTQYAMPKKSGTQYARGEGDVTLIYEYIHLTKRLECELYV